MVVGSFDGNGLGDLVFKVEGDVRMGLMVGSPLRRGGAQARCK